MLGEEGGILLKRDGSSILERFEVKDESFTSSELIIDTNDFLEENEAVNYKELKFI